nr:MAG TPA: hypothetical protein [Caudoviricetes sp.]
MQEVGGHWARTAYQKIAKKITLLPRAQNFILSPILMS